MTKQYRTLSFMSFSLGVEPLPSSCSYPIKEATTTIRTFRCDLHPPYAKAASFNEEMKVVAVVRLFRGAVASEMFRTDIDQYVIHHYAIDCLLTCTPWSHTYTLRW